MGRLSGQDRLETKIDTLDTVLDNVHDTDLPAVKTVVDGVETHVHSIETKVDTLDTIIDNLHDTDIPDLHTDIADLHTDVADIHTDVADIHTDVGTAISYSKIAYNRKNSTIVTYGGGGSGIGQALHSYIPIAITSGNALAGNTSAIYSKYMSSSPGSFQIAGTYLHPLNLLVTAVTSANVSTRLWFYTGTFGAEFDFSMANADGKVTATASNFQAGDVIQFYDISPNETHGLVSCWICYVIGSPNPNDFYCSYLNGGAAIDPDAELTGHVRKITATLRGIRTLELTATTQGTTNPIELNLPAFTEDDVFFVKADSETGHTSTISFFYDALVSANSE